MSSAPTIESTTAVRASIRDLVALTKPRITLMVILTTAGGLWLAPESLSAISVLFVLLGTTLVVGAANTLNCWLERDVDRFMTRTRTRPLPSGRLPAWAALALGLTLAAISLPMITLASNPLTGLLAAIALTSYVLVYTPMKQHHPSALLIGAVPGALPPLMGWTAATGELGAAGWVLFGILFIWQLPHFIAIATFRAGEYTNAGIKVLPAVRGKRVGAWHAILWAAALIPVSLMLIPLGIAGALYGVVVGLAGLVFFAAAVRGLLIGPTDRWAKQLFFTSLLYLPLVFAALALDVALLG